MEYALQLQLREFGLNPLEWKTFPITANLHAAVHRDDPELMLTGLVRQEKGQAVWEELSWFEPDSEIL